MNDGLLERRFFIRDDYVANAARTAKSPDEYWNERRIERSALFQYHVYRCARGLLHDRGDSRVLDLGCGTARKAVKLLIPNCGYYCGIDKLSAVEYCRSTIDEPHAEFVVADLEAPKFQSGAPFDLIVCADVIEHLDSPDRLLQFAAGRLAPAGVLVLSTPEREILVGREVRRPSNPEHVREWNRGELHRFLSSCGFNVRSIKLAPQFRISLSGAGWTLLRSQLKHPMSYWGCQIAICVKA